MTCSTFGYLITAHPGGVRGPASSYGHSAGTSLEFSAIESDSRHICAPFRCSCSLAWPSRSRPPPRGRASQSPARPPRAAPSACAPSRPRTLSRRRRAQSRCTAHTKQPPAPPNEEA
eukprot:scaffold104338_cov33-Phaeocystis_antarctica.AAC.1